MGTDEDFQFLKDRILDYLGTLDNNEKSENYGTEYNISKDVLNGFMHDLLDDYHSSTVDLGMEIEEQQQNILTLQRKQCIIRDKFLVP